MSACCHQACLVMCQAALHLYPEVAGANAEDPCSEPSALVGEAAVPCSSPRWLLSARREKSPRMPKRTHWQPRSLTRCLLPRPAWPLASSLVATAWDVYSKLTCPESAQQTAKIQGLGLSSPPPRACICRKLEDGAGPVLEP